MDYNNAFYSGLCLEMLKILRLYTTVNDTENFRVLLIITKDWYLAILDINWGSFKEAFFPFILQYLYFDSPLKKSWMDLSRKKHLLLYG